MPLTQLACSFLENYIKAIHAELLGQSQTNRLFLSARHRPMGKNTTGQPGREIREAGEGQKTRHLPPVAASHVRDASRCRTKPISGIVQEILGHRLLTTTERYLHLTITRLESGAPQTPPA